ncbi:hypothetical protein [Clostridium butyricum]|uniref:hypothetical protein n=1 Tax=Clostridium butyricum TaxID=1492 RepID=UPI002AB2CAB0|nr:hypothetical protein [Clostridium butyricum]
MSNIKRKIENIKINNKDYIMAFDMNSVEVFQTITGKGVLKSISELNRFEDKTVLAFLASTIRPKNNVNEPIGIKLYSGDYDLLALMIMMVPTLVMVINQGFPETKGNSKKKSVKEELDLDWMLYAYTKILGNSEEDFWNSTPRKIFSLLDIHCKVNKINKDNNTQKKGESKEVRTMKVLD